MNSSPSCAFCLRKCLPRNARERLCVALYRGQPTSSTVRKAPLLVIVESPGFRSPLPPTDGLLECLATKTKPTAPQAAPLGLSKLSFKKNGIFVLEKICQLLLSLFLPHLTVCHFSALLVGSNKWGGRQQVGQVEEVSE